MGNTQNIYHFFIFGNFGSIILDVLASFFHYEGKFENLVLDC